MQTDNYKNTLIIYDDRAPVTDQITRYVGQRSYGDIWFRNQSLYDSVVGLLPKWAAHRVVRVTSNTVLGLPYTALPQLSDAESVIVLAASGAPADAAALNAVIERVVLARDNVIDRPREPLFRYFKSVAEFIDTWETFKVAPLHTLREPIAGAKVLASPGPLEDISESANFLDFMAGATTPRGFNRMRAADIIYTKQSEDKAKIRAEHDYYRLLPEEMKHWFVGAFGYEEKNGIAEYKMPRRYMADAAIQWIHSAWSERDFKLFLERILYFLENRPEKKASSEEVEKVARELFEHKVRRRQAELVDSPVGASVSRFVSTVTGENRLRCVFDKYFQLMERNWSAIKGDNKLVIGHGDPCLSNILYDKSNLLLQLIDPKGALTEAELWTHPLYDYCKLSHSILGDYDLINNKKFSVFLDPSANVKLKVFGPQNAVFKQIFRSELKPSISYKALRLGEASLFLSMMPLHVDHADKVAAFLLRAESILSEIDSNGGVA